MKIRINIIYSDRIRRAKVRQIASLNVLPLNKTKEINISIYNLEFLGVSTIYK